MRRVPLGFLALLPACTQTMVMQPRVLVTPYYAGYRLRGDIAMQNDPGTGPVDNASQSLRTFGSGDYEDDIGVRVDIGDTFAGLRLEWYHLGMNTSKTGVLGDDFGSLLAGDTVRMNSSMDEFRIGYAHPVWTGRSEFNAQPLEFKLAAGGVLAHRDLAMHMQTDDNARRQDVRVTDNGVVYPAVRFRATWQSVSFDLEYAISPDLVLGGEFSGVLQDFETRLIYRVPMQDVGFFAGYRYSTLPVEGHEGALAFDGDLRLDGLQLGIVVSF